MSKDTPQPGSRLSIFNAGADRARLSEVKREQKAAIERELAGALAKFSTPDGNQLAAYLADTLTGTVDKIGEKNDEIRRMLLGKSFNGEPISYAQLQEKTEEIKLRIAIIGPTLAALVRRIANGERIDNEELASASYSRSLTNIDKVSEMLEKGELKDLEVALRWALNVQEKGKDGVEHSVDWSEEKAFPALSARIDPKNIRGTLSFVWSILMFAKMDPASKENKGLKFLDFYIAQNKLDAIQTISLLKEANKMGIVNDEEMMAAVQGNKAFSKQDVQNIMGNEFTDEKRRIYAELYKHQNNFYKEAKLIGKIPYGSTNAMSDMFTLGNIAMVIIRAGCYATIAGNTLATIFNGGKLNLSSETIKNLVANRYILGSTAILVGDKYVRKGNRLKDSLESQDSRETRKDQVAINTIQETAKSNIRLREFLATDEGLFALGEYTKHLRQIMKHEEGKSLMELYPKGAQFNYLSLGGFMRFLERRSQQKGPDQKKYTTALANLIKDGKGISITHHEMANFINSFDVLNIWGANAKAYRSITTYGRAA